MPAKNNDTRIHIVATAYDYHGNLASQTNDVIYEGVNDVTIPKASWISPLDGAALPAGDSALAVKLRGNASVLVRAGLVVPLGRPAFVLDQSQLVYRPSAVTARVTAGLQLGF